MPSWERKLDHEDQGSVISTPEAGETQLDQQQLEERLHLGSRAEGVLSQPQKPESLSSINSTGGAPAPHATHLLGSDSFTKRTERAGEPELDLQQFGFSG